MPTEISNVAAAPGELHRPAGLRGAMPSRDPHASVVVELVRGHTPAAREHGHPELVGAPRSCVEGPCLHSATGPPGRPRPDVVSSCAAEIGGLVTQRQQLDVLVDAVASRRPATTPDSTPAGRSNTATATTLRRSCPTPRRPIIAGQRRVPHSETPHGSRFVGGDVLPRFRAQLRFEVFSGDPGEPLAKQSQTSGGGTLTPATGYRQPDNQAPSSCCGSTRSTTARSVPNPRGSSDRRVHPADRARFVVARAGVRGGGGRHRRGDLARRRAGRRLPDLRRSSCVAPSASGFLRRSAW